MSDDNDQSGIEEALGRLAALSVKRKVEELALLADKAAKAGFGIATLLSTKGDEERPTRRAYVAVLAGDIPEDLGTSFADYFKGLHQDLYHEAKTKGGVVKIIDSDEKASPRE